MKETHKKTTKEE